MAETAMFHDGNRQLQDRFGSRGIADRLEEKLTRKEFSEDDERFIESQPYFFLATADAHGRPDCSFKGGAPGFVRVTGPSEIAQLAQNFNGLIATVKTQLADRVTITHGLDRGVTLDYGPGKLIGFVTQEHAKTLGIGGGEDLIAVYLPMSYQIGGYTLYVSRSKVHETDLTVEQAMRIVLTGGVRGK